MEILAVARLSIRSAYIKQDLYQIRFLILLHQSSATYRWYASISMDTAMPFPYRPLRLLIIVNTNLKFKKVLLQSSILYQLLKIKANSRDTGLYPVLLPAPGKAGP